MSQFKNFPSPHCHIQSLDTGCLPESFADREIELGTGTLTSTDHGTLGATRTLAKLAKKKGLIYVPGLEGYFRDDDCPIIKASGADLEEYLKYGSKDKKYNHITMHALDQAGYETMVKLLSRADLRSEKHGSERKPLFGWAELEELGAQNITMTSSCLIGMVSRHVFKHQNYDIAEKYFDRLKAITKPGNFYAEVFPHKCDSNFDSAIYVVYEDGTEERFVLWKKLMTDEGEEKAEKWAQTYSRRKKEKSNRLLAVMENAKWVDHEPKAIKTIEKRESIIMNECQPWCPSGDVQEATNKFILRLAEKNNVPVLISDDAHFARPEQKMVQDIRLATGGGSWKFTTSYHRLDSDTAYEHFRATLGLTPGEFEHWVENNREWAQRFKDFKFKDRRSLPTHFYPSNTLKHTISLIEKHARIDWKNPQYVARLKSEINMLHKNGTIDLLPYFFPEEEVCSYYERELKMLTGPGRGSAAGLLLSYYLGITHVDPIRYGLSADRFLTQDRIEQGKLPDIDQDLPNRDPLLDPENGWLKKRFGDHYCQVSVDTTLKLRSAVLDVARVKCDRQVPDDISKLTNQFINAPQGVTDSQNVFGYKGSDGSWVKGTSEKDHPGTDWKLVEYIEKYPTHWEVVRQVLGIPRQKGRHACAYLIADEPIENFIPTTSVSGVKVTQYTAESCEMSGAIKYDFLGLNSLNDIDLALKLIRQRQGTNLEEKIIDGRRVPGIRLVPHNGELYDVWDLPEVQDVFREICSGKTETVFQFDTPGAKKWMKNFEAPRPDGTPALNSIEGLAAFTALDRPGPLDYQVKDPDGNPVHNMLIEYAHRARGESGIGRLPLLDKLLPETHGVIVYQEQLSKVFKEIGGTTGIQAENFRIHTSKKQLMEVIKDKELFMPGATAKLGEKVATELWESLETFGQYGFNKSHAVCYVVISYACAFLKHFYPLEWWTAVLRNASKNEVDVKFWQHCGHLILLPDISKSGHEFQIEGDKIRAPLSLLNGIGPKAHEQLMTGRPYETIEDVARAIQKYKQDNATEKRAATSALNRGVMYKLIISGALDSLFKKDLMTRMKLEQWERALYAVAPKGKAPLPVNPAYGNLTELQEFQFRKNVLPAYSYDLLSAFGRAGLSGLGKNQRGKWTYQHDGEQVLVIRGGQLDVFAQSDGFIPGKFKVAVPVYVVQDERKTYQKNGRSNQMQKLLLDIGGQRREFIRWPGKSGKLPESVGKSQVGCVGLAVLGRYTEDRPFSVEELLVVQAALVEDTTENK